MSGGPSSQAPPPKWSPVAPLSWRHPNTQPQVGVGQQCCVCQVPLGERGVGEHTPLLQPELGQKQLSGFRLDGLSLGGQAPRVGSGEAVRAGKRMGWAGARGCSPSSCPSRTLRPVRGTGEEVFSLGPTWPVADRRAVLNIRPGPTGVGFWLLAPCCPNPFPCPDAQGPHRAKPPLAVEASLGQGSSG